MADALPSTQFSLRDRRDEFTRRAILVEARRILAGAGVDALSLRTLAEAVGYSPAALYRYFANKEAIFAALRAEGVVLLAEFDSTGITAESSPTDQLVTYARRIVAFAAAYPDHYRLMFATSDAPPLSAESWRADPHTAELIATISRAAERRAFDLRGRTAEQVVFQVWLLAHGAALLRQTVLREDESLAALVDVALASVTLANEALANEALGQSGK